jgi:hypothetical protein
VTEKGTITKAPGATTFDVPAFFRAHGLPLPAAEPNGNAGHDADAAPLGAAGTVASSAATTNGVIAGSNAPSPGFQALTLATVIDYVAARPAIAARVGPPGSTAKWRSTEIGDGNINFIYLVEGPAGRVIVKQALPYVRCVGEAWPLSQARASDLTLDPCLPCGKGCLRTCARFACMLQALSSSRLAVCIHVPAAHAREHE